MEVRLSKTSADYFNACELAKSITSETPNPGTQCWIFVMDDSGALNRQCEKCPYHAELTPESSVKTAENGASVTVTLKGEISEKRAVELKKIMDAQLKTKSSIFVDCAGLTQIEPVALGILLRTYKLLKEKQGDFFLISPSDAMLAVLQSTLLIKIIPAVRSMDEAAHFIRKKEEAIRTGEARAQEEAKKKRLEVQIKQDFRSEMENLDRLKQDIQSNNVLISDMALTSLMKGQTITITDENDVKYEPQFSVKFKKTL